MRTVHTLAEIAVAEVAADFVGKGGTFDPALVRIEVLPKPHTPTDLPAGRMAVYCFFLGEQALKIGIAGPNSNARYRYQHYKAGSAGSTLAASILRNPGKVGQNTISADHVGAWIQRTTDRVNILVPISFGRWMLPSLEQHLHKKWMPIFEGRVA